MSLLLNNPSTKGTKRANDIDLGRLIGELIDQRKLIITVVALFTLIALIYALFATPVYQADALIQVEQKKDNAIVGSLSNLGLSSEQIQSAPEIALLKSRMVLGKTVDDLNLQTTAQQHYFPVFGRGFNRLIGNKPGQITISQLNINDPESTGEPQLSLEAKGNNRYTLTYNDVELQGVVGQVLNQKGITLKVDRLEAEPGTDFDISYVSRLKAITNLQEALSVADQGKDTGVLTVSINGEDPVLIKNIIASISDNYVAQNIARQAAQDAKSYEFIGQQLPVVRQKLDVAEDKLNQYRRQNNSVDLSLETKSVLDQIVNVENQLNELTFREAEISQLFTKSHPTYKALLEKEKTLRDEKNKLNQSVTSMPETQQEILRLSRDVEAGRAVYMQLLNRQQELNIKKSSTIGNARIVDEATTQLIPVKPKKTIIVLAGIVFGCVIALGIVFLRVYLRRGIESPEQLENLGINVYASIPVSETKAKLSGQGNPHTLLAVQNPADLAIEAIRGLRTSLHFSMMEARNNILMISGASPNAGKTFVSTNLAAIVAQSGKKVLFVDADMRKGYTHKIFSTPNNSGFADYLAGKVELNAAIKKVSSAGFDYIPSGTKSANPAELLMDKRFADFITWASTNYDMVIIDTPPILAVTDPAIIGHYAGATLLVARVDVNTTKEINVSVKRFEQNGVMIKGCILNGIEKKASGYYSHGYDHYGYSYSKS
ncbi:TPA: polysaccharide biosynthesis tyrosine autokinase [Citrobacter freundii]